MRSKLLLLTDERDFTRGMGVVSHQGCSSPMMEFVSVAAACADDVMMVVPTKIITQFRCCGDRAAPS